VERCLACEAGSVGTPWDPCCNARHRVGGLWFQAEAKRLWRFCKTARRLTASQGGNAPRLATTALRGNAFSASLPPLPMKLVRVNVRLPGVTTRIAVSSPARAFHAYHGVTSGRHQAHIDRWSVQGYRMISLSVYGDPDRPLYAAVWVRRDGPAWEAIHDADATGYQSFFDRWTARRYVPVLISATGPSSNAVFAAVFERDINGPWLARYGMSSGSPGNDGTFENENANAAAQRMILRSVAVYGSRDDRRYAAVWHSNPVYVKWRVHSSDSASNYQMVFDAETKLPGYDVAAYRPAYVAVSNDLSYCSLFKDDVVGPWVTRNGMTGIEYQAELDHQIANGFYPICVQGGGSTINPVYAAIFATQDTPLTREFSDPADPRSDSITIQQLLDNRAGYDEGRAGFDPTYNMRSISLELGLTHPVTKLDVARYMYGRMAGAVVEHITGETYIDYLNERLLTPAGISEVKVMSTLPSGRTNDEAIAEDQGLGLSPLDLRSQFQVPCVYGGNGQINEVGDANYGIGASAQALTQFIHRYAVWDNGPRALGHRRSGSGPGASCLISSPSRAIGWALTTNTRDWPPATSSTLMALEKSINELLDRVTIKN
jgi:Polyglycine hydrolase-like, structural repeat/Beta-lactamase